jgi:hypothetical protein
MQTENAPAKSSRKKQVVVAIALILLILALLLSRMQCRQTVTGFDYFQAKAESLGQNADRILGFVRNDVHTLPYRGDARGPLAALWDASASPEEKVALANAILVHASSPRKVGLDDVAADRDKSADRPDTIYQLTIVHRLVRTDGAKKTRVFSGSAGSLVGEVHSIEMLAGDQTRITLRGATETTKTVSHARGVSEEIVFTVERPDGPPLTVTRELWHRDNHVGRTGAEPGDRHDFVVLPCRVGKYVREKEELLLKQRGRDEGEDARHYLALLDYAALSDTALARVEKSKKVRAMMEIPRIHILSRFDTGAEPGFAIDLRLNRTSFEGDRFDGYVAAEMRSFAESGLEDAFLAQWSGCASTSAYRIFCQLRDDYPNTSPRRLDAIVSSLGALAGYAGLDGRATFRARPPNGKDARDLPSVVATREAKGLRVRGGPVNPDFARQLARTDVKIPFGADGSLDAVFDSLPDAAVAVEVALMAAQVRPVVSPAYVLETRIDGGTEPLVTPGARFRFAWGEGAMRTDQRITVRECTLGLDLSWRVQTGARPASGTRTISGEALNDAVVHNPWYRAGASSQKDVTSFCVSRKVLAELKAGRPIELTLQGRYKENQEPETDKRPVEWSGSVTPAGIRTSQIQVNGQPASIRCVQASMPGGTVAILDDPLFPVGMADRLVEVWTSIRGRLVDEDGIGIGGAEVKVESEVGEFEPIVAQTWPDGSFRLPPSSGGGYGQVRLKVTQRNTLLGEPEVDLTAPGLGEVKVTVPRPRRELAFLSPNSPEVLDELAVSDEVKRHARADLAAGNMVVIPRTMVAAATGQETIGYYAYDVRSGNIVGVTEDGLNGANLALIGNLLKEQLKESKGKLEPPKSALVYIHMYRGINTAAWTYCSYRLEGQEHEEAIATVIEQMDYWEKATNLMENFGEAVGQIPFTRNRDWDKKSADQIKEQLTSLFDSAVPGVNDDWAKRAFQYGYVSTCLGLSIMLEGS